MHDDKKFKLSGYLSIKFVCMTALYLDCAAS